MIVRPMLRRDLKYVTALMGEQYQRWHEADPRLPRPPRMERAVFDILDFDWDDLESWAYMGEDEGGMAGYLRAGYRSYAHDDPQRIWLPGHHGYSDILYQFAARQDLDPGEVFAELFETARRKLPGTEPWVMVWAPPVAGLGAALEGLGFLKSSIFGYRYLDDLPEITPPEGVRIRAAEGRDKAQLEEMLVELHRYHEEVDSRLDRPLPGLRVQLGKTIDHVLRSPQDHVLLVAEDEGGELLALSLSALDVEEAGPWSANRFPGGAAGFLEEFYVVQSARRKGIGRALVAATLHGIAEMGRRQSKDRRLEGTWLIYRSTNPTSSRFWPALGFSPLYEMWRLGGWN